MGFVWDGGGESTGPLYPIRGKKDISSALCCFGFCCHKVPLLLMRSIQSWIGGEFTTEITLHWPETHIDNHWLSEGRWCHFLNAKPRPSCLLSFSNSYSYQHIKEAYRTGKGLVDWCLYSAPYEPRIPNSLPSPEIQPEKSIRIFFSTIKTQFP